MSFAETAGIHLAVAAAVILTLALLADRWRRGVILGRFGDPAAIRAMMASVSPERRAIKAVLLVVAVALLVLAAARPQVAGDRTWRRHGIDVAVVLDVSKSMLVTDVAPSRLVRARAEIAALVAALESDRIAAVLFAGAAAHFPLTTDRDVALHFALELGPADVPAGSDLREGLRVARCLLRPDVYDDLDCERLGGRGRGGEPLPGEPPIREAERGGAVSEAATTADPWAERPPPPPDPVVDARGKAIVVFTDGGDQELAIHEVERARALGIEVFLVGVGTAAGGEVPEIDDAGAVVGVRRDRAGLAVISRLDDTGLRQLAAAAGGEDRLLVLDPARPADARPLRRLLERVKRGDLETRDVKRKREVFHWFLFPALMLLVIEACVGDRKRRTYPESESQGR